MLLHLRLLLRAELLVLGHRIALEAEMGLLLLVLCVASRHLLRLLRTLRKLLLLLLLKLLQSHKRLLLRLLQLRLILPLLLLMLRLRLLCTTLHKCLLLLDRRLLLLLNSRLHHVLLMLGVQSLTCENKECCASEQMGMEQVKAHIMLHQCVCP